MKDQERKLLQRIDRRKAKVKRLIEEQNAYLAALKEVTFLREGDYRKALLLGRKKLNRLKQELRELEAGRLPGLRAGSQPDE